MKLTFGKHKSEQLEETPETYILWLAQHEKVLMLDNRKFAKEAHGEEHVSSWSGY